MFILYSVVIGLAVGLLTRGRLAALADVQFKWPSVVFAGLLVQLVLFTDTVAATVGDAGPPLYVGSTLLTVAAIARNWRLPGIPLVLLGAASNLAAILANGGYMPASPGALAALGKLEPTIYSNSAVLDRPQLAPLTDVFALPGWLPLANIFSIGDVLIAVGVVLTIVFAMHGRTDIRHFARGASGKLARLPEA